MSETYVITIQGISLAINKEELENLKKQIKEIESNTEPIIDENQDITDYYQMGKKYVLTEEEAKTLPKPKFSIQKKKEQEKQLDKIWNNLQNRDPIAEDIETAKAVRYIEEMNNHGGIITEPER